MSGSSEPAPFGPVTGPITYEPELSDGRRIDFVIDRGRDNLYIEVKTVRPR